MKEGQNIEIKYQTGAVLWGVLVFLSQGSWRANRQDRKQKTNKTREINKSW